MAEEQNLLAVRPVMIYDADQGMVVHDLDVIVVRPRDRKILPVEKGVVVRQGDETPINETARTIAEQYGDTKEPLVLILLEDGLPVRTQIVGLFILPSE